MSDNSKPAANHSESGSQCQQQGISTPEPVPRRRPIPRKGHTKSRAGCLKCKSRKVKCDELTPRCGPCQRLRLVCEFPSPNGGGIETSPKSKEDAGALLASTALTKALETRPGTFGMTDLRFFQHFLVSAHPPFPIGGRLVWLGVSQMTHEFDFLAHSILGLGASHLSMFSTTSYTQEALRHRIIAIKSLNEFLSRGHRSLVSVEAAFATTLTLSYQAAHMPDGLYEFLTITRGCFLVGELFGSEFLSSAFKSFERETYVEKVTELIAQRAPHYFLSLDLADGFCDSLEKLGRVCRSVAEIQYLVLMRKIASSAVTDVAESYRQYTFLYENLARLSSPEYASFIDPKNNVSRMVIMHMLVLDYIMSNRIEGENRHHHSGLGETGQFCNLRSLIICVWVVDIDASLPLELGHYASWPVEFIRNLMGRLNTDQGFWRRLLREATVVDRLLPKSRDEFRE